MRVPVYSSRVSLVVPSAPRVDAGALAAPGVALARGASQVNEAVTDYAEKVQKAQRAIELADATTKARREFNDLVLGLEQEQDWRTGAERFDEGVKTIRGKYVEAIKDPVVRQEFQAHFDRIAEEGRVSFARKSVGWMQKAGEATLLETLDEHARAAADAPNDLARETALSAAAKAINDMADAGVIDPVARVTIWRKFKGDVDETQVLKRLNRDEGSVQGVLEDLLAGKFVNLDPERRERLRKAAEDRLATLQRERVAATEKAEREAEKRTREAEERTAADLWDSFFRGELTFETLSASRRRISQEDFTALGRALRGEAGNDDPDVVASLVTRLDREDIVADATAALKAGRLKIDTYRSLVAQNRAALADDQPASPYKSGRELVNVTLRPPEVLGAGAAQDAARAAQAQALVEFDNWFEANPGATRAQAIEEAQAIIRRYQVIAFERMSLGVGLPRAYRGARNDIRPEDLDHAERETLSDLDARRITEAQAAQELRKIEAWREILARRPSPAPATGGRK